MGGEKPRSRRAGIVRLSLGMKAQLAMSLGFFHWLLSAYMVLTRGT